MTSEPIVATLDIGTAYTTAIVAAVHGDLPRTPTLRVLGVGSTRTMGLRRGVVSDIEEATRSIRKAVEEASRVAGVNQRLCLTIRRPRRRHWRALIVPPDPSSPLTAGFSYSLLSQTNRTF